MANANGWGDGASNNTIGWGKGADNAIGWGAIHADSYAGLTDIVGAVAFDADAQAFITAAAITDPTQQAAINTLVVDLKGYSIWTKFSAIYPMVGGTNTSNSYNLKNTAQYQISWAGGVTSSANGVTFGVNGYGNTGLNPTTALSLNNTHLSFYSRTDGAGGIDIGAYASNDLQNLIIAQSYFGNFYADSYSSLSRFILASQVKGLFTISRTAINSFKAFKNAAQIGTTIITSVGTLPNWNIFLGAANLNAGTNPSAYSARNQAFASIGDGLTDAEAANFYTAVQAFQTTLGRQV